MGIFNRREKDDGVAEAYAELRGAVLDAGPRLGPAHPDHPEVLGAVVDIPSEGAWATLVALGDGTTSLYTSSGGGILGGGEHEAVVAATHALLVGLQSHLVLFEADDVRTLPPADYVRFTVLGPDRRRIAHVPSAAFWGEEASPVADLIADAQAVISRLREVVPAA